MAAPRGFFAYNDRTYRLTHAVQMPATIVQSGDLVLVSLTYPSGTITATCGVDGVTIAEAATPVVITGFTHRVFLFRATSLTPGNTFDVSLSASTRISCVVVSIPGVPTGTTYLQTPPAAYNTTLLSSTTKTTPTATAAAANTQEIAILADTEGGALPGTTAWVPPAGMTLVGADYNENGAAAVPVLSTAVAHNPTLQANGASLGGRVFTETGGSGGPGSAYTFLITSAASTTADAGSDQTVEPGSRAVLGPGSGGVGFNWQPAEGIALSSLTVASPVISEVPAAMVKAVYENKLSVVDSGGVSSAYDSMLLTVLESTAGAYVDGTLVPIIAKLASTQTVRQLSDAPGFAGDYYAPTLAALADGADVGTSGTSPWVSRVGTSSGLQATSSKRPAKRDSYQGKLAVELTPANLDHLTLNGDALSFTNGATAGTTVYMVCYPTGDTSTERGLLRIMNGPNTASRLSIHTTATTGLLQLLIRQLDGDASSTISSPSALPLNQWQVITAVRDWANGTSQLFRNGTSLVGPTTQGKSGSGAVSATNAAFAYLGSVSTVASFFGGAFVHVLLFNAAHNATQRALVHSILQDTDGVAVSDYVAA